MKDGADELAPGLELLANYPRERPLGALSNAARQFRRQFVGRGVLSIVDRSQLNGAFGQAASTRPTAVRDAAGYEMTKITVSGNSWNLLLFKGRIIVDARDMADLLRCIDTTTEHEQAPLLICSVVSSTPTMTALPSAASLEHFSTTSRCSRPQRGPYCFPRRRCTKRWFPRLVVQGSA